ncbi:MAG: hypothetical protein WC325_10170 [Candidatus Bathyarchaeia archaeon]
MEVPLSQCAQIQDLTGYVKLAEAPKRSVRHVTLEINADLSEATSFPELLCVISSIRENLAAKYLLRNVTVTDKTVYFAKRLEAKP